MTAEAETNFAAITSGVISMLGAPHVPVSELPGGDAGLAFLGFPFDGANAAIERPGSANGPRGLRVASNMCFPWSFEWDIDLFEAYRMVDCGDAPLAIGNVKQPTSSCRRSSRRSSPPARSRPPSGEITPCAFPVRAR